MQAVRVRVAALLSGLVVLLGVLVGTLPATAGGLGATAGTGAIAPSLLHGVRGSVRVVVQAVAGTAHAVERAVTRDGGRVTRQLPIIDGFAATVPASRIAPLARVAGVRAITPDSAMHVQGTTSTDTSTIPSVYRQVVQADKLGADGYNGQGVTVALIDTGVDNLPDLAGRIVPVTTDLSGDVASCMNFSGEPGCQDSFGHGTFVAGLIAGNGAASDGQYVGAAPQANILSVKIAGASGASDVSNVLAAIQWVVSFKNTYNIQVMNLSLGTDSTQSYHIDPLDYAVEKAWQAGITVVVAASNQGPNPGTISDPADDPFVITVGAVDDMGTPGLGDDELPNFTGRGPTAADGLAKPDVVAPGCHVVSLVAPNSTITNEFPPPSDMTPGYRRGSGTSFATGIVSGLVADMLSANPSMTPDRIKYALTSTARADASSDTMAVGAGMVSGYDAVFDAPPGLANQGVMPSDGTGSLQASRGTVQVEAVGADGTATIVNGNLTTQLTLWDPATTLFADWTGSSWWTSAWTGSSWWGSSWWGNNWMGSSWWGSSWWGQPDSSTWYGNSWYGSSWWGAWDT